MYQNDFLKKNQKLTKNSGGIPKSDPFKMSPKCVLFNPLSTELKFAEDFLFIMVYLKIEKLTKISGGKVRSDPFLWS